MTLGHAARRALRSRSLVLWLWLVLLVPPGAAHAQSERVTGDWQQFVLVQDAWRPLGIYRVERSDGEYRMTPVSQSEDPGVTTSKGLSGVRFSGAEWRFKSDWGNGNVAEFRLRHVGPGVFVGWSYLRDEQVNLNLWMLVR